MDWARNRVGRRRTHGIWYRRARSVHADRCRSTLAGMHALVSTKRISLTATKITLVAGERTLARMNTLVRSQSIVSCAAIVAFVAGVWAIIGMRKLVSSESTADCTSIVADVAGVWTLSRMNTPVHSEIAAQCTSILALVAGERTLARVSALMCNKRFFSCTSIIALVARERALAGMDAHVQCESAAIGTSMLAFVAGEWTLVELAQCSGATRQIMSRSRHDGQFFQQFSALVTGECCFGIDLFFTDCFIGQPCLDVACNQISPRHETARGSEILVRGQRGRGHVDYAARKNQDRRKTD